jgi:hypothetical protein
MIVAAAMMLILREQTKEVVDAVFDDLKPKKWKRTDGVFRGRLPRR